MAIRVGNKAEGDDFFDRLAERETLWRYLESNHIQLSGPRRLGKTSLLQRLAEEATAKGLFARLVDVEGIDSVEEFVAELGRAFPDHSIKGYLKDAGSTATSWLDLFRRVELKGPGGIGGSIELQAMPKVAWAEDAGKLQRRLSEAPLLILIDEFTVFLEKLLARDLDGAKKLLGWLRAWRMSSGVACRFIYSGSVGFNALLDRYRLSSLFNDCYDFRLGPFREKAAIEMLEIELAREAWVPEEGVLKRLCDRVGWLSPFYLNLLLAVAIEAATDRVLEAAPPPHPDSLVTRRLIASDVDDGYDRLLATRSRFIHWYQRLERDLPPADFSFCLAVLAAVARSAEGLTRKQLLARLQRHIADPDERSQRLNQALLRLEEDGYLDVADEQIRFLSFLLRDYWKRNHV